MTTIGIIGAGHIGSQVARKAVVLGYDVVISNSRGTRNPQRAGHGTWAACPGGHGSRGSSGGRFRRRDRSPEELPGTSPRSRLKARSSSTPTITTGSATAAFPPLDNGEATTSGLLQKHLPTLQGSQGLQPHLRQAQSPRTARPPAPPNRRALATASDFPEAAELVTRLYDEFGFDTVNIGPLPEAAGEWSATVLPTLSARTPPSSRRIWPRQRGPSRRCGSTTEGRERRREVPAVVARSFR